MSYKATTHYRAMAILWTLIAFLAYPNVIMYNLQLSLVVGFFLAGVVTGGGLGLGLSQRTLRSLERKGETQKSLFTIFYAVGTIFVVTSALFFFGPNVPLETLASTSVFIAPIPAATFAISSMMFSDWERRNKRTIFNRMWRGGLYVTRKIS
jgi:hypothetical protein